jgi:chemotaxis protein CheX
MRAEFINPFLAAAQDVFRTMLSCELSRGPLALKRTHCPEYEVNGLIGLSGKCQGMVVVGLGRETALKATERLVGACPAEIDADVLDAVGEITNMIAGAAKAKLEAYELSVGLPTVICGKHHVIAFPSKCTPVVLPFSSALGPICLDVGLSGLGA